MFGPNRQDVLGHDPVPQLSRRQSNSKTAEHYTRPGAVMRLRLSDHRARKRDWGAQPKRRL